MCMLCITTCVLLSLVLVLMHAVVFQSLLLPGCGQGTRIEVVGMWLVKAERQNSQNVHGILAWVANGCEVNAAKFDCFLGKLQ